jgi:hypothetical protein
MRALVINKIAVRVPSKKWSERSPADRHQVGTNTIKCLTTVTTSINLSEKSDMKTYAKEELESKSRKEIQSIAKEFGLKANAATQAIVEAILAISCTTKAPDTENVTVNDSVEPSPHCKFSSYVAPSPTEPASEHGSAKISVNDTVMVLANGIKRTATVKRINKKSVRVCLHGDINVELTVKTEEVDLVQIVEHASDDNKSVQDMCTIDIKDIEPVKEIQTQEQIGVPDMDVPLIADNYKAEYGSKEVWATGMETCLQELSAKLVSQNSDHDEIERTDRDDTVPEMIIDRGTEISTTPVAPPAPASSRTPLVKSADHRKRKSIEIGASLANVTTMLAYVEPSSVKLADAGEALPIREGVINKGRSRLVVNSLNKLESKSSAPDFSKMHAANFSNQKSIVSMVQRVRLFHRRITICK